MIDLLTQFGVAGLMGALWIWERMHSRRREAQLSAAHEQLMKQERQLASLVKLVRHNTKAMVELERSNHRIGELLEEVRHAIREKVS